MPHTAQKFFEGGETPQSRAAPSLKQFEPTFSDDDELEYVANRIILNASGTLHYEDQRGTEITYDFPAGQWDVSVRKIYSTGTTLSESNVLCLI